ncbi:hypothetical protein [Haloferula sp. BvORR071]|uniref:hypothetical protein n=1 Tax=Haloferula sp. BvORR071 TaxID=1396141 RepID=UPI0005533FD3|nr:hypothetical protein [Haloferula sp. BvORR071]
MHLRFVLLLPLAALVSCSAGISYVGRDPAKLVGKQRSAILAEFGTPRPYHREEEGLSVDRFRVAGVWRHSEETEQCLESLKWSAGLFEVVLLPVSVFLKTNSISGGQTLRVEYDPHSIVTDASVKTDP